MKISPALRKKITVIVLCALLIAGMTFLLDKETSDSDDMFWEDFVAYFHTSQPEQIVTKQIYQRPAEGISVAVPVIVYHGVRPNYLGETADVKRYTVEPDTLDHELAYLHDNNYHVIALSALSKYFDEGVPIPEKPIVLTFDDGWKNQYTYAYPILKKYGFTATFFIFTNAIGHKNFMTWDQIKEIDASGMTIGGHTKTHPYLTGITDPIALEKEINGGKKIIEEHLGHPIETFAYPFGLYNASTTEAVRKAGYRIARTSKPGLWHTNKDLLELRALYDQNSNILFSKFIATSAQFTKMFDERPTKENN